MDSDPSGMFMFGGAIEHLERMLEQMKCDGAKIRATVDEISSRYAQATIKFGGVLKDGDFNYLRQGGDAETQMILILTALQHQIANVERHWDAQKLDSQTKWVRQLALIQLASIKAKVLTDRKDNPDENSATRRAKADPPGTSGSA